MAQKVVNYAVACRECFQLLARSSAAGHSDAVEYQEWISDQDKRFALWTAKLGVFAHEQISLKHRLRKNTAIAEALAQVLDAMLFNLRIVTTYCCGEGADKLSTPTILALSEEDDDMSMIGLPEPTPQDSVEEDTDLDPAANLEEWSPSELSDFMEDLVNLDARSKPSTPSGEISDAELSDQSEIDQSANEIHEISILANRISESIDNLLYTASLIRDYNAGKDLLITQRYGILYEDYSLEQGSTSGVADDGEAPRRADDVDNNERIKSAEKRRTVSQAFEAMIEPMLKREFGKTFQYSTNAFLKDRLSAAMKWRWRRVCYRSRHASDLEAFAENSKAPESTHNVSSVLPENPPVGSVPKEKTIPQGKGTSSSFHGGSTLPSNAVLEPRTNVPSAATKSSRPGTRHTQLPPMPTISPISTEYMYVCPYCRRLPVLPGHNNKIWKHHLWEDLAPFLCLYEECGTADVPYTSKHSWLEHIRANHLRPIWLCPWCDGENNVYDTDAAFRGHITSQHDTSLSDAEILLITKSNQRSQPFACCLICEKSDGMSDRREGTVQTPADHQNNIISCMVSHLEVLALVCIPWHIGDMDDAKSDSTELTDRAMVLADVGEAGGVGHGEGDFAGVDGVHATDTNEKVEVSGISDDSDPVGGLVYPGEFASITASALPPVSSRDRVTTWFRQDAMEEQLLATAHESENPDNEKPDQSVRKRHKTDTTEDSATRRANWMDALQVYSLWISAARVQSTNVDDFIPSGEVDAYLRHHAALEEILDALFSNASDRPSASQILQSYHLVFTILIASRLGHWIAIFLKHESLCDSNLPFRMITTRDRTDDPHKKIYTIPLASASLDPSLLELATGRISNGLLRSLFEKFQASQARFCAPKLVEGYCYEFDADEILPYLERRPIGEGGGAKVYRVKIHANHDFMRRMDGDTSNSHRYFALKVYDGKSGDQWYNNERKVFQFLGQTGLRETHIIGHHCTYSHKGLHHVLLEHADLGTLEDFMQEQSPPSTYAEIVEFWQNLLKIIDPIVALHNLQIDKDSAQSTRLLKGVHQGIKPRNILVKSSHGASSIYGSVFGLSDFGTSQLVDPTTGQSFTDNYGTKAYGAPECFRRDAFDDGRKIRITQSVDVYSLGCVWSEVCVWIVFGKAGLEGYRQLRRSHNFHISQDADCFHVNGLESAAVDSQHEQVLRSARCDGITANILRLLPHLMMADFTRRPHAWMLSAVFSELMSSPEDSRPNNWATETLHKLMSPERTSLRHLYARLNLQDTGSDDTTAPAKVVRGLRIQFSEQEDTTAATSATSDRRQESHPGTQAGTSHAPDAATLDHRQRETPRSSVESPTAARKRKGPSSPRDTSPSTSASMATSISKPVKQEIAHYRLTLEIVERELQRFFPSYAKSAFDVREGNDVLKFLVPRALTRGQRDQILARRIRDRNEEDWGT